LCPPWVIRDLILKDIYHFISYDRNQRSSQASVVYLFHSLDEFERAHDMTLLYEKVEEDELEVWLNARPFYGRLKRAWHPDTGMVMIGPVGLLKMS
jgi:hypothetical protein